MNKNTSTIDNLLASWHTLHDLDRAYEVSKIHRGGSSLRAISRGLNCSEAQLRHLLKALKALPEDRSLARQNIISTNELVRRSEGCERSSEQRKAETAKSKQVQASQTGCKRICDWITSERLTGPAGVNIVTEARLWLRMAEERNQLPRGTAPVNKSFAEIVACCRPGQPLSDTIMHVAWYAEWLALWAYYAMVDPLVRYKAVELALEKQHTRLY